MLDVQSQQIDFYKEDLTFRISNDTFFVSGNYYLKSDSEINKQISLFYEVPTDSIYYYPVNSTYFYNITTNEEIKNVKRTTSGMVFPIFQQVETTLFVSYQQKLKSNTAKYILRTTRYWRKPFEEATYKLIIPNELEVSKFTYVPDKTEIIGDKKIYYWSKKDFMPSTDMEFEFK